MASPVGSAAAAGPPSNEPSLAVDPPLLVLVVLVVELALVAELAVGSTLAGAAVMVEISAARFRAGTGVLAGFLPIKGIACLRDRK